VIGATTCPTARELREVALQCHDPALEKAKAAITTA
jgi:hypothetical protein